MSNIYTFRKIVRRYYDRTHKEYIVVFECGHEWYSANTKRQKKAKKGICPLCADIERTRIAP